MGREIQESLDSRYGFVRTLGGDCSGCQVSLSTFHESGEACRIGRDRRDADRSQGEDEGAEEGGGHGSAEYP